MLAMIQNTPSRRAPSRVQNEAHISHSQLRTYAGCPLAWKLSRLHRPEQVSASLLFGSAFHAAAERLYQMRLEGVKAVLSDLLAAYDEAWARHNAPADGQPPIPLHYPAKSDADSLRQTAVRMLEAFLVQAEANPGEVIAVEEPFSVELAPELPLLQGRIDLIEVRSDAGGKRTLHLVDFKTSARQLGSDDIEREQLDFYALAVRKTGLLSQLGLPLTLRVDVVTKTKAPAVTPVCLAPDPANEARVVAKAQEIWKGMASGICYPSPNWRCSDCGHKTRCGKWPDGIA